MGHAIFLAEAFCLLNGKKRDAAVAGIVGHGVWFLVARVGIASRGIALAGGATQNEVAEGLTKERTAP